MEKLLDDPLMLGVTAILGLISFALTTAGLKNGNISMAVWGVAIGTPTYAPDEPFFWGFGLCLALLAYWLQKNT